MLKNWRRPQISKRISPQIYMENIPLLMCIGFLKLDFDRSINLKYESILWHK